MATVICLVIFLCVGMNCKISRKPPSLSYGSNIFRNYCSPCHIRYDSQDTPGLITFNRLDSMALLKALSRIKQDSTHAKLCESLNYDHAEVESVYQYIRDYFSPRF
jgi:hypothetical protein